MRAPSVMGLHGFCAGPLQWQRLAPDAFCPFLTGHGSELSGASSFDEEVLRLAAAAERLPAPRRLLGYSMGARVALGLLVQRPDLFEDAVLVGGSPGLNRESERAERLAWEGTWIQLLEEQGIDAFAEAWQRLPLFSSQSRVNADDLTAQDRQRRSHSAKGLSLALRALGLGVMPSLWQHLGQVQARVTLVVGEHDQKFTALAEQQAQLLPRARVVHVAGAGHNPLLEAPEALMKCL